MGDDITINAAKSIETLLAEIFGGDDDSPLFATDEAIDADGRVIGFGTWRGKSGTSF